MVGESTDAQNAAAFGRMVCKDGSGDLASSERATSSLTARGGVMFSNASLSGGQQDAYHVSYHEEI